MRSCAGCHRPAQDLTGTIVPSARTHALGADARARRGRRRSAGTHPLRADARAPRGRQRSRSTTRTAVTAANAAYPPTCRPPDAPRTRHRRPGTRVRRRERPRAGRARRDLRACARPQLPTPRGAGHRTTGHGERRGSGNRAPRDGRSGPPEQTRGEPEESRRDRGVAGCCGVGDRPGQPERSPGVGQSDARRRRVGTHAPAIGMPHAPRLRGIDGCFAHRGAAATSATQRGRGS